MLGAAAAQASVLGDPPGHTMRSVTGPSTGLRRNLAAGVKVSIRTGREAKDGTVKGEGVRVITTGSKLPEDKQPMVKAYMARKFRHPVYGKDHWVEQQGKNWFYGPLMKGRDEYQRAVVNAIEEASKAIAEG